MLSHDVTESNTPRHSRRGIHAAELSQSMPSLVPLPLTVRLHPSDEEQEVFRSSLIYPKYYLHFSSKYTKLRGYMLDAFSKATTVHHHSRPFTIFVAATTTGWNSVIISVFEILPNNILAELPQHFSSDRVPGPWCSLLGRVNFAVGEVGAIVLV